MQPSTVLKTNTDFLPFDGVYRRKDQVVLVEMRHARLIVRGIGRIEDQLGQEALFNLGRPSGFVGAKVLEDINELVDEIQFIKY